MAQRLGHQPPDVARDRAFVVAPQWPRAVAQAAQVGRDHCVVRCQRRHGVPPFPPGLRPAVQQHHRRPLARGDVVQHDLAELRVVVLDRGDTAVIAGAPIGRSAGIVGRAAERVHSPGARLARATPVAPFLGCRSSLSGRSNGRVIAGPRARAFSTGAERAGRGPSRRVTIAPT